jgi:hypothetical protein
VHKCPQWGGVERDHRESNLDELKVQTIREGPGEYSTNICGAEFEFVGVTEFRSWNKAESREWKVKSLLCKPKEELECEHCNRELSYEVRHCVVSGTVGVGDSQHISDAGLRGLGVRN